MRKVLNLPFELLMRSKRDDVSFEMLVCALLIKSKFQNSVFFLNVTHVMRNLGVSYKKAKKIIERMKSSDLFVYNEKKNCVFAKSFKSKVLMVYGRKKYMAFADGCRKVDISEDDTLRTLKHKCREYLLIHAFHANEHDHFNVGDSQNVTKQNVRRAMTNRKMGCIIGMSKSSGRRYCNGLIDQGRVSKSGIVAECVIEDLNEITEAEWYRNHPKQKFAVWHNQNGGWSGWIIYGFVYSLSSRDDVESMKHVIWNHKLRLSSIVNNVGYTPDGEAYWSKHN